MSESSISGSCLCGAAQYTVTGEAVRFYHCHCSRCRKASGTGHASNLFVKGSLHWDSGEELIQTFKLPEAERFSNTFCKTCGGRLPRFIEAAGMVFIPAGSLNQEPTIGPQARIFVGSRASWSCEQQQIPEFESYPS
ncbi:MAG: GFA family protein [Xanthomonadales bacterium]|nr:GFA family protein [Xanthomonadales bacterium]